MSNLYLVSTKNIHDVGADSRAGQVPQIPPGMCAISEMIKPCVKAAVDEMRTLVLPPGYMLGLYVSL